MPHADLFYTKGHNVKGAEVLAQLEDVLRGFDAGASNCKGRAHLVEDFHHDHIHLKLSLLPKAHRDAAWAQELGSLLAGVLKPLANPGATVTVNLTFDLVHYTALKV